jgi:ribose 5-phosphate isomerase RpiB
MQFTPEILPDLIKAVVETIDNNAEEVTALDQAIGVGASLAENRHDFVINNGRCIWFIVWNTVY